MTKEITPEIEDILSRMNQHLTDWYIHKVLKLNSLEVETMSGEEFDKYQEGITIEQSTDKHQNTIYSAKKDGKIISQFYVSQKKR